MRENAPGGPPDAPEEVPVSRSPHRNERAPAARSDAAAQDAQSTDAEAGGSTDAGGDDPLHPAGQASAGGAGPTGDRRTVPSASGGDDGLVSLVGAGPGDPGLLTRRAWGRLRSADVVLYDSLTDDALLGDLPPAVEVVDVGKRPPDRTSQAEINALMCDRATSGERVVRLKGGDPNVFGRGGEEAEHLAAEGVRFEVVPGVSSVLAAPGVSGIPLTHRECSSSLTVITGHQTPEKEDTAIDWAAIADSVAAGGTLVVLMGVSRLPENAGALRDHGVDPATPVAMVERATWDGERTVTGTLADIVERSREAAVEPPAVTVVGEVVAVRDDVVDALAR